MCRLVFIGTDNALEEIPPTSPPSAFCIRKLDDDELTVKQNFTKQNVYYVSTFQGCGCGFGNASSYIAHESKWDKMWARYIMAPIENGIESLKAKLNFKTRWEQQIDDYSAKVMADEARLIRIIEANTTGGKTVELFCHEAVTDGAYYEPAHDHAETDLSTTDLQTGFIVETGVLRVFFGSRAGH